MLLVEYSEISSKLSGEIELDESYFGPRRVRGKHGTGANTTVFSFAPIGWLLKRNGKVYTQVVKNCSKKELEPLILKHAKLAKSTIYSDKWAARRLSRLWSKGSLPASIMVQMSLEAMISMELKLPSLC